MVDTTTRAANAATFSQGDLPSPTTHDQAPLHEQRDTERLRLMVEAAPNALILVDAQGRIGLVNRQAEVLTGYTRQALLGQPIDMLLPARARGAHVHHRAQFARAPSARQMGTGRDLFALRQDGREVPVDVGLNPIRTADGTIVVVSVIDITERKRAEEALRISEAKARAVFDLAFEFIGLLDPSGTILDANQAALSLAGVPAADVLGRPFWDTPWWRHSPEEQARLRDAVTRAAAGEFVRFETTHPDLQGQLRVIDFSLKPLRDESGAVVWLIPEGRDITEHRKAEEERRAYQAHHNQAEKMEAIGTLASGLAHDFNNILGAILANLAIAQDDVGPDHPASVSLAQIDRSVARAAALVQQILAFGRPRSTEPRLVDLEATIRQDAPLLRAIIPAEVALTTSFAAGVPDVLCDPNVVNQILVNLCTNACHAIEVPAGRIEIGLDAVTLQTPPPEAPTLPPGRYARVRVRDNGKGMDAATRSRIFEPFFTTKEFGKGTGLGLAMVHRIMTTAGGAILVRSEPGQGATFDLLFPAAAPAGQAEPPSRAEAGTARGHGQRVLFVDDEDALVAASTRALARRGFQVTGCRTPCEAIAAVRADPDAFDVVVTDYSMPGASGIDVARAVRAIAPGLPVVLASGNTTDAKRAEADEAGIRDVIDKPYAIEALCATIERLCGGSATADNRHAGGG